MIREEKQVGAVRERETDKMRGGKKKTGGESKGKWLPTKTFLVTFPAR